MFERNRTDSRPEPTSVPVELELIDGSQLRGKLIVPSTQAPLDVINGPGGFVEFVPYAAEARFIAKSTIAAFKLAGVPRAADLRPRGSLHDEFEPYTILGIPHGSAWEDVRAAYVQLTKTYHPDRYSSATLPPEVSNYLETMARRINAAYAALDTTERTARRVRVDIRPAVYTSTPR